MIFNKAIANSLAALSIFCALPGSAEEVSVREIYLKDPTPWCAPELGVPVVVEMSGLHVSGAAVKPNSKIRVRERRGLTVRDVDVSPVRLDSRRERSGDRERTVRTKDVQSLNARLAEAQWQGVLVARFNLCLSVSARRGSDAAYSVVDDQGGAIISGRGNAREVLDFVLWQGGRYPKEFRIDDATFIVLEKPRVTRTIEHASD